LNGAPFLRAPGLRASVQRRRLRLLRPPEIRHQGLRLLRLRDHRLPGGRPRQDGNPRQRRAGGRTLHHSSARPAEMRGRAMCVKLRELIPQHPFKIQQQGGRSRLPQRVLPSVAAFCASVPSTHTAGAEAAASLV